MNLTEYRRQYSLESIHETTVTREHSLIREISERRVPEAYQSEYYIQFSNPALRIKGQNGVLKDENHASEVPVDKPSSNKGMDSINSVGTIRDQAEHKIIEPEVTTGKVKALRDAIERHEYNNAVLGGWNENSSDVTIARSPNKAITTGKPPIIQYGCGNTNPAVPQHYMKTFNVKAPVSEQYPHTQARGEIMKAFDETVLHPKPSETVKNPIPDPKIVLKYYNEAKNTVKQIQNGYISEYKSKYLDWSLPFNKLKNELKDSAHRSSKKKADPGNWYQKPTISSQAKSRPKKQKEPEDTANNIKVQSIYDLVKQSNTAGRTSVEINSDRFSQAFREMKRS